MMWTGLVIAIALTAQTAPAGQTATTVTPDVTVQGARQGASTRSRDPNEVICENRATTGTRFTNRRCRTRAQALAAAAESRRWLGEAQRGGPTPEDLADRVGPSPIGP